MDNIPGVFFRCACDEHWTMLHMSCGVEKLIGYPVDYIVGNNVFSFASLIHPDDADDVERDVLKAVEGHAAWNVEYRLSRRDGSYIWVSEQGVGIYESTGQVKYLDGFVADISERKQIEVALKRSEQRNRELAYYDSLTGLPNRNLIFQAISDHLENFCGHIAVLYIDLDRFKAVNDNYGHDTGDEVLAIVGSRFKEVVPEDDLIARIGGDEFMILCSSNVTADFCIDLAQRVINRISQPISLHNKSIQLGASIGISFSNVDGCSMHSLIVAADKAMFRAKATGSNLFEISRGYIVNQAA